MSAALDAATLGVRGANPLVGAALVAPDGRFLAVAHHRGAGTDHAEVAALSAARDNGASPADIAAATMYVSLEPCAHTGRTPPCTEAIIRAGVRSVVVAVRDPNPVAAGGIASLRANGVHVREGLGERAAYANNRRWFATVADRRPFVTLKLAQSLDGSSAAADGSSHWITGAAARADGHRMRERTDVVLIGTGTALADDPALTARRPDNSPARRQPLRAVMGLRDVPARARIRGTDDRFVRVPTRVPRAALAQLYDRGARSVLIDGSPTVAAAFIAAGLVDELVVYLAPLVLGGRATLPAAGLRIDTLTHARKFAPDQAGGGAITPLGPDVRLRYAPEEKEQTCSPE